MREETRIKTIEEKQTVYISSDNVEFTDKEECRKYEESACGVLLSKLVECEINSGNEYDFFNGFEDTQVRVIVPVKQEHLDAINQLYHMWYPNNYNFVYATLEDLGRPILLYYYVNDNKIDALWLKKLDKIVSFVTKDMFKLNSVKSDL